MDTADQTDHSVYLIHKKHLREISSITFAGLDSCFSLHLNYYLKRKKEKHFPPKGHLQTPSLRLIHTHTQILDTIYFYIIEIPSQLITAALE